MPAGATRLLPNANSRSDFLGIQESYRQREDGCIFGALEGGGKGWAGERIRSSASPDAYPVSKGHSLVIPRRHGADGMALRQPERNAVVELLRQRRAMRRAQGATINGGNVGLNSAEAAGQTVVHAHWHLNPRREGNCEKPRVFGGYGK